MSPSDGRCVSAPSPIRQAWQAATKRKGQKGGMSRDREFRFFLMDCIVSGITEPDELLAAASQANPRASGSNWED